MTIEEIRNQLKDVVAQVQAARDKGITLAADNTSSMQQLREAAEQLEALRARESILRATLEEETERQSHNLSAMKSGVDGIRAAASKFRSMGDFMACIAQAGRNGGMDPRLADYANVRSAASGQNLTTDAEGGYLVPPDYAEGLLNVAQSESILFSKVQHIPISGNRLIVNEVEQVTRADTSGSNYGRNGGLLAYWTAEAANYTASTMHFKQQQTDLHKLTGLCYATEEMLEDLPALSAYIAQGFSDEFAFKIDDAIMNGTGSGMPLGILAQNSSAPAQNNGALVKVAKESGQAAATVVLNNILKMFNAMPARNRANAEWYINQDLEIVLMQLLMNTGSVASAGESAVEKVSGTFGVPIYVPAGGIAAAPNGMLLGRPIVPVEQASALGTMGDITFADMSQYRWIDKGGINAQTSVHVRFIQDEQAFKFTYRAGGRPIWSNTITANKGGTVRSPYVALATRS